jgi:hypothetical protein
MNNCKHDAVQILDDQGQHQLDICEMCGRLVLYRVVGSATVELWSGDAEALAALVAAARAGEGRE